jgi:hypothetical protein
MIKNSDQQRNKFFNLTFPNRNINENQSSEGSQKFRTPVITNPDQRKKSGFCRIVVGIVYCIAQQFVCFQLDRFIRYE